jgi:hypothetical protein
MSQRPNALSYFSNTATSSLPAFFSRGTPGFLSTGLSTGWGTGFAKTVAYLVSILIVLFVLLLFVHFFIRPVFRLHPGAPGIVPVPGYDDGVLFWNKGQTGKIANKDLPISDQCFGYSMIMDILVENPFQFSNHPRILFHRGGNRLQPPQDGNTILSVMNQYNIVVALLPDTNDMIVSVLNKDNNMENIILSNVPIQESFRLGIVVMDNALEVYLNGHLVKTRAFSAMPLQVLGDMEQAKGIEANVAKVRNLKIWPRVVTASEIRFAKPSLSPSSSFGARPIPPSTFTSCPASKKS